jgi:fructokinase
VIVLAGEALIDLAADGDRLVPLPGGSPYNVAIGVARLGRPTGFVGRLSTDGFGRRLQDQLASEGVDLSLTTLTDEPTTLAVVHLDERRQATYRFYLAGTSAAGMRTGELPELPNDAILHVSFGAIGPGTLPAGHALSALLGREHGHRLTSLDPNVRPAAIDDLDGARLRLEALLAKVDVVKVSDEDLAVLYPGRADVDVAAAWLERGPALVVVTRGAKGGWASTARHRIEVGAPSVDVVDTVGAGDAYSAGLLSWLDTHDLRSKAAVEAIEASELEDALGYAARVAALTCTRPGADPPRASQL